MKGGGLLGILKKIIFIFNTLQKMVTKMGHFTKLKCKEGSRKICHNFFFLKIARNPNCFGKFDWSMNSQRQRAEEY